MIDPYVIEARRRLAEACEKDAYTDTANGYKNGAFDFEYQIQVLAASLRELNWQPPVDPDEVAAHKIYSQVGSMSFKRRNESNVYRCNLAAYRAGKAAATPSGDA